VCPVQAQKAFGDAWLAVHKFIPHRQRAVSTQSWNLIFDHGKAGRRLHPHKQEPFALDTRLNAPT